MGLTSPVRNGIVRSYSPQANFNFNAITVPSAGQPFPASDAKPQRKFGNQPDEISIYRSKYILSIKLFIASQRALASRVVAGHVRVSEESCVEVSKETCLTE